MVRKAFTHNHSRAKMTHNPKGAKRRNISNIPVVSVHRNTMFLCGVTLTQSEFHE